VKIFKNKESLRECQGQEEPKGDVITQCTVLSLGKILQHKKMLGKNEIMKSNVNKVWTFSEQ
jgi:hypothetical protein